MVMANTLTEESTSPLSPPGVTGQRASFGRINLATFTIVSLRCAAEMNAQTGVPSVAAKNAVAAAVQEDGWALWTGFYRAIENGDFEDHCNIVHFDFGAALEEQGGCVGWQQVMRVELGGIKA